MGRSLPSSSHSIGNTIFSVPEDFWVWPGRRPTALVVSDVLATAEGGRAWSSRVWLVIERETNCELIYKSRRLLPTELIEIDATLVALVKAAICELPHIVGWAVYRHQLHLVLERVEGISASESRDAAPRTRLCATMFSTRETIRQAIKLVSAVQALHSHGLIYQDVRIGQLLVSRRGARLVDIDTIVTSGGICAKNGSWLPTHGRRTGAGCDFGTDVRLVGEVTDQLFAGHFRGGLPITRSSTLRETVDALRVFDGCDSLAEEVLRGSRATLIDALGE
jgi:serine/threonine protein kinase